jgi:hypothetical protein
MGKKRTNSWKLSVSSLILTILFSTLYIFLITPPKPVFAKPKNLTYCTKSGCHTVADADATQYVARDAINITSGLSIFIGAGRTVELDWYANNTSYYATVSGAGVQILIPTNWTATAGTNNSPNLTNWNSVWDIADGVSAGWVSYTSSVPAGFVAYVIDYANSVWDRQNTTGGAHDNGVTGNPGDQDGVANRMGTDAKVTVGGSASGDYSIYVDNIGHDGSAEKKSYKRTILNVRIANMTSLSTDKSSYNTLGESIIVTGNYNNTSTSTNLTNSTINYQIFIDSDNDGNLDPGETYIDSAGYPQTASTGNETTKVTSAFNVNANTTVQDQWSINNQYFTTATNYTLKSIWKESSSGVIDVEKDASPFYTFYSVPTLGWSLILLGVAAFVIFALRKGVLQLRRS